MRAYLDVQAMQGPFFERGIPRYVASLSRELIRSPMLEAFGTNPSQRPIDSLYQDIASHPLTAGTTRSRWRSMPNDCAYVCTSAFEGMRPLIDLWPSFVIESGAPTAAIVYDTIPLRFPAVFQRTRSERQFYASRSRLLAHADLFLAISQSAAKDLVEDLGVDPGRVRVIGTGIDERFIPGDPAEAQSLVNNQIPAIVKPYVLNVAGWPETKNVLRYLEAIASLPAPIRDNYQFVIACRAPVETAKRWHDRMSELGLANESIVITGFVSDALLVALYQAAELCVCPSLYEGFGLPVAEAAACGIPAICSNTSSLPEVLNFPAATFDPSESCDIAARILSALTDSEFRSSLVAAGELAAKKHRWDVVAKAFCDSIKTLNATPRGRVRSINALVIEDADSALDPSLIRGRVQHALIEGEVDHIEVFTSQWRKLLSTDRVNYLPHRAMGSLRSPAHYDRIEHVRL